MRKWLSTYLLIAIALQTGCSKKTIDLDLTQHVDQKLVVEGRISNVVERQEFTCSLTSDFGATAPDAVTDADITIYTDEGIYHFSHSAGGLYGSDVPFAGIPGQTYSIEILWKGEIYDAETIMASPVYIDSVWSNTTSAIFQGTQQDIKVRLGSEADQYIRYKIYAPALDSITSDTIWTEYPVPVYWVTPVFAAPNQIVTLPANDHYFHFDSTDRIKIEVYSISTDIGEYLLELRDYMNKELPNSQYHNPPFFYSNDAYGMGYGGCLVTAYYVF